ncbi:unnamed protein product [Tetraodon nigroviridis]|uniref:(spotted green pufferfish) hypothetical protein n=1 Tax=Tetraodon nigroviridis TaxID=99883 RepID=Q4SU45_TETNG|nr:unnamed protein product [Tetraodon nigroviridis]
MVKPEEASTPSGWRPPTPPPIHHSLPSPSLCCACGLCTMLAGINVTLVGVLTFGSGNVTIIVGPLLLLVAAALFVGCCVVSRSRAHVTGGGRRGQQWGRMQGATVALEMETSEHTLQDTTAVQLSPPHSTSSSHKSNSSRGGGSPASRGPFPYLPNQFKGSPAEEDAHTMATSSSTLSHLITLLLTGGQTAHRRGWDGGGLAEGWQWFYLHFFKLDHRKRVTLEETDQGGDFAASSASQLHGTLHHEYKWTSTFVRVIADKVVSVDGWESGQPLCMLCPHPPVFQSS